MKRGTFRIAGQAPKVRWKRNVGRRKRTIEEAVKIAKRHGVVIPDDVEFVEAEPDALKGSLKELFSGEGMETAKGPEVRERPDGYIYWQQHVGTIGKIVFRIHPEILTGDECIVAVFQHEMFELAELREVFMFARRQRLNGSDYGFHTAPGIKGNIHDRAWNAADEAVLRMRGGNK